MTNAYIVSVIYYRLTSPLLHFVPHNVGALALLLSMKGTYSARQTVHLLSTAIEWRAKHPVANDAKTCAETATSSAFLYRSAGVVAVREAGHFVARLIDRTTVKR